MTYGSVYATADIVSQPVTMFSCVSRMSYMPCWELLPLAHCIPWLVSWLDAANDSHDFELTTSLTRLLQAAMLAKARVSCRGVPLLSHWLTMMRIDCNK